MRTLQDEVISRGFKVAHIKTDSIKIPDATPEIIDFCMKFAEKYGYTFEHEATYDRMCLVNDAVYIAKYAGDEDHEFKLSTGEKIQTKWTATGTQFMVPYVFKKCFTHSEVKFADLCEFKSVQSAMYLDMNENMDNGEEEILNKVLDIRAKKAKAVGGIGPKLQKILDEYADMSDEDIIKKINSLHNYKFVGKVGQFCPVKSGLGGGLLVREQLKKDGTVGMNAVVGTSGYRWLESENVDAEHMMDIIDISYYNTLANNAIEEISKYGDYEWFVSDDPYISPVMTSADGGMMHPDYEATMPF